MDDSTEALRRNHGVYNRITAPKAADYETLPHNLLRGYHPLDPRRRRNDSERWSGDVTDDECYCRAAKTTGLEAHAPRYARFTPDPAAPLPPAVNSLHAAQSHRHDRRLGRCWPSRSPVSGYTAGPTEKWRGLALGRVGASLVRAGLGSVGHQS